MYYRIAIPVDALSTLKWKSTVLSSLNSVILWLQYYWVLPHNRLRIFSAASPEDLNEQLVRENQRQEYTSVSAAQFLQERRITPRLVRSEASAERTREIGNERTAPIAVLTKPTPYESYKSPLDRRRKELESGLGGDHDLPYLFTLPTSMPQVLAWVKLVARVQQGDLQSEVFPRGTTVIKRRILIGSRSMRSLERFGNREG